MFGLDYLEMMLKVASSDDLLTIHLGTDYPVRLHFEIGSVVVEYFLAPRIEYEG
jgi:proliferating cell nuclear antigen